MDEKVPQALSAVAGQTRLFINVRYLLPEEILAIHDETIEKEGGTLGVRDFGLLASLAVRPQMSMMGQEFYPSIFSKAASILEGIATYHVFADGNKRTSIISCSAFLSLNGYELTTSSEVAYRFVMDVAVKKKTIEEIAKWLKKHSKKIR